MELNKGEFIERATKLIEENNELGLIILCTVNKKKVSTVDDRPTQMKKLTAYVKKNFYTGSCDDLWNFIKKRD